MKLIGSLARILGGIQKVIFPYLEEEIGELTEMQKKLIRILEITPIAKFVGSWNGMRGRPRRDREKIARAFVAKATYNIPNTKHLIERIKGEKNLRIICGWERKNEVPHESTFSRAFEEFAKSELPARIHEEMIKDNLGEEVLLHISRDSTSIEGREKPQNKEPKQKIEKPKRKKGRRKKGEEIPKSEPTRLERQLEMTPEQMLGELPKVCDVGCKKNSKGYKETWIGYKLHIDAGDGQIPISCILTSASVHDSQVALPLAEMTKDRVTNCYDIMDSAYDSPIIRDHSSQMGHVPIIDVNTRRNVELRDELNSEKERFKLLNFKTPEDVRFNNRTNVERVNSRMKDEFGAETVRVKGHAKVFAHLMFGIIALTADQLFRLVT